MGASEGNDVAGTDTSARNVAAPWAPDDQIDRHVVEVRSDESELRTIRRSVADFVIGRGGCEGLKDDLVIAACELSTNVMQHTRSDTVTVAVRSDGSTWQLDVSDADRVPPLDAIDEPPPTSTSGRGLMIVKRLMDDVRVLEVGGRTVVRCTRRCA